MVEYNKVIFVLTLILVCLLSGVFSVCRKRCRQNNPQPCGDNKYLCKNDSAKPPVERCYLREIQTDDTAPSCNSTTAEQVVQDCNFTTDLCNWRQSNFDNFDWTRNSGSTPSSNTGPSNDYSGIGYYMYIEASFPDVDDFADLVSPLLEANRCLCIQLYTNMYGLGIGSISLLVQEPLKNETVSLVTFNQPDSSAIWRKRSIYVAAQKNAFSIIIRGIIGPGYKGDAAIDNIHIKYGNC